LKFCYYLQTNPNWQTFLYLLTWLYLSLILLEPNYSGQEDFYNENPEYKTAAFFIELSILIIYLLDLAMDLFHRKSDTTRSFQDRYLKNFKLMSKLVIITLCVIDYTIFYSLLPTVIFRFSKPLRPCNFGFSCVIFSLFGVVPEAAEEDCHRNHQVDGEYD
jgi:hypothetical protein